MTVRQKEDDWGGGVDDNGGEPRSIPRRWLTVTWEFPTQYNSQIQGFEVVVFTGTDPADASTWLFIPKGASTTDRAIIVGVAPNVTVSNLNAAVRAVYV